MRTRGTASPQLASRHRAPTSFFATAGYLAAAVAFVHAATPPAPAAAAAAPSVPALYAPYLRTDNVCAVDVWADLRAELECPDVSIPSAASGARGSSPLGAPVMPRTAPEEAAESPPPPALPGPEEGGLESFEEWKKRQEAAEAEAEAEAETEARKAEPRADGSDDPAGRQGTDGDAHHDSSGTSDSNNSNPDGGGRAADRAQARAVGSNASALNSGHAAGGSRPPPGEPASAGGAGGRAGGAGASAVPPASPPPPGSAPPEKHRYNYASPDCSARVLASSPQTQHASSLLHKSRDRYMLTPCRADEHWVVIELCDEIRIEAIELAVWEFFSGVVREVRVSVGGEEGGESSGRWREVGSFVGKNVRGVQKFALAEPTSFYRFIRLDFPSYYGTEYYCPVSQLKVFGMNQMEAFKMEQRRLTAAAGVKEQDKARERAREAEAEAQRTRERDQQEREDEERRERELCELEKLVQEQALRMGRASEGMNPEVIDCAAAAASAAAASAASASAASAASTASISTSPRPSLSAQAAPHSDHSGSDAVVAVAGAGAAPSSSGLVPPVALANTTATGIAPAHSNSASASASYARQQPVPRSDSSESIYAFILRRVGALEGNSTLVARYIDEQGKALRAALAKAEKRWESARQVAVDEDQSRWESEVSQRQDSPADGQRMRHEDRLGRMVVQMEQMRTTLDAQRRLSESQFRVLTSELGYERRRSFVQLFLLGFVIIVGAATRSETIDKLLRLVEVRRPSHKEIQWRKGRHQKRLSTGPLAGLVIDVPPPGLLRESQAPTPTNNATVPRQSTPHSLRLSPRSQPYHYTPRSPLGAHHIRSTLRRPATPTTGTSFLPNTPGSTGHNRRRSGATSRSFSSINPGSSAAGAGFTYVYADDDEAPGGPSVSPTASSASRGTRPGAPVPRGPSRRLARSAHLHTMRRRRDDESSGAEDRSSVGFSPLGFAVFPGRTEREPSGTATIRAPPSNASSSRSPLALRAPLPLSPGLLSPYRGADEQDFGDDSQWGTEDGMSAAESLPDTSGSASASEADDDDAAAAAVGGNGAAGDSDVGGREVPRRRESGAQESGAGSGAAHEMDDGLPGLGPKISLDLPRAPPGAEGREGGAPSVRFPNGGGDADAAAAAAAAWGSADADDAADADDDDDEADAERRRCASTTPVPSQMRALRQDAGTPAAAPVTALDTRSHTLHVPSPIPSGI